MKFRDSSVMLQTHGTSSTSAVKLLHCVSKCLGLVGFTWNHASPSYGKLVVSIARIVVHILVTATLVFMDLQNFQSEVLSVPEVLTVASKTISHILVIILCLCNERNICRITKTLERWSYQLVTERVNSSTIIVTAQLCLGITVILLSNRFDWCRVENNLISVPRHVLYIFTDFSTYVVELQFINFVLFVKQHFAGINLQLRHVTFRARGTTQLTAVFPPAALSTVQHLNAFHDILCDIAQLLNCVYSPIVLIDVGFSLFRSTQKLNRIFFSNLGRKSDIFSFYSLIYKCFHWTKFIFLIYACRLCSNNVSLSSKVTCVSLFAIVSSNIHKRTLMVSMQVPLTFSKLSSGTQYGMKQYISHWIFQISGLQLKVLTL
jgi:hypothetical protein